MPDARRGAGANAKRSSAATRGSAAKARPAAKPAGAARRSRLRPSMRLALLLVVLVGLLFAFVYPTRTFLDQRAETNKARAQLDVLRSENAQLERESKRLSTDSEIERIAREQYGLVKPGERPFVILPTPTTAAPPAPPPTTTRAPLP